MNNIKFEVLLGTTGIFYGKYCKEFIRGNKFVTKTGFTELIRGWKLKQKLLKLINRTPQDSIMSKCPMTPLRHFIMNVARNMSSIVHRIHAIREQLFSPKCLLYTNVGISISLSAAGDALEQHYEILKGEWDKWSLNRTRNMAASGMAVGIVCHYWYKYLDARLPGRTVNVVLKKVFIDQLICSPLCITMFFLSLAILENSSWSELKSEITRKAHRLYIAEWVVWPPAQILNFYFLPNRYRVLYDNTISLGYDVYTSQVKHDNVKCGSKGSKH